MAVGSFSPEVTREITGLLAMLTALLLLNDRNFVEGNPSILVAKTDVPGKEIKCVISLESTGRTPQIWTPDRKVVQ